MPALSAASDERQKHDDDYRPLLIHRNCELPSQAPTVGRRYTAALARRIPGSPRPPSRRCPHGPMASMRLTSAGDGETRTRTENTAIFRWSDSTRVRVETIRACAYSPLNPHNVNSMCEVGEVSVLGPDLGVADERCRGYPGVVDTRLAPL